MANFKKMLIHCSMTLLALTGVAGPAPGLTVDTPAIRGYDAVSYFKNSKAQKGNASFTHMWRNRTWHFATPGNRDLFAADPGKYAPQYDGYCAWAMAEARKAETDPEVWKIVGGKLYLNCSQSAYEKWSRDIPGNIKKSDENWIRIFGGK